MAKAPRFDWDEANIGHIARHGVTPEEVEQAYANDSVTLEVAIRSGEERILAAGRTDAGRPLQFVYTLRRTRIRVVTAYTAHKKVRDQL